MVPLSYPLAQGPVDIGISCWPLFGPMFARVCHFVIENLNSRTLVEQETIGRATVHSIGRVIGVSPFSAATHPHNECCRGMASGNVVAAKCLAHSTRKGDLLFVLLRFLRGLMVFRDRRPHYYFGHDGPTGSSPLSVGIKVYNSCHWLASLLVAC